MKQFVQAMSAAFKKADKPLLEQWATQTSITSVPDVSVEKQFSASHINTAARAFNQLHHWQQPCLHPCFALFLGLSQHVEVLTSKASPFPLMGLVHTDNAIVQHKTLLQGNLTIRCYFGAIRTCSRGVSADVILDVSQEGRLCQTITSTYLYRVISDVLPEKRNNEVALSKQGETDAPLQDTSVAFSASAGRQYARLSGDYNPIHLYGWSAKLFGFRQAIAHGTNVLARCVSAMSHAPELTSDAFSITNAFHYPVPLPCVLTLVNDGQHEAKAAETHFELRNPSVARRKQVVLSGQITA